MIERAAQPFNELWSVLQAHPELAMVTVLLYLVAPAIVASAIER
jgi:hypothetical protein